MIDAQTSRLVEACKGMSEDEIIAAHYAAYYDETKPHMHAGPSRKWASRSTRLRRGFTGTSSEGTAAR